MKNFLGKVSIIAFISVFVIFSNSCERKQNDVSMERLEDVQKYYDEAVDMYRNDSLQQAFDRFIDVLALVETLPEEMTEMDKHLASKSYCNITRILNNKLERNVSVETARKAFYYQQIADEIDTLTFPMVSLLFAGSFDTEIGTDSMIYYTKLAIPYIDTLNEDVSLYIVSQQQLSVAYRHQKKYDSCFQVKRHMIAFKNRRGIDAKADSLALGIDMFYSSYKLQSKPYLMKVLDIEMDDLTVGLVMQLLEHIYQMEGNADSVEFCRNYYKPSFEAEMERVNDVDIFIARYNAYSTERDNLFRVLREQKERRKRNSYIIASIITSVMLISALTLQALRNKRRYSKRTAQLHSQIANNEFKYALIDGKIKKMNVELRKKEEIIKEKESELNEIRNKIERTPDIEAYYKSEICRKINSRRTSDVSALSNEELALLLQTADKHLNNITMRLKEKYPKLNKDDMYYICLILLNTEEYNLQYLLGRNRKTVWYRLSKIKSMMNLENNGDILTFVMNNFIN